MASREENSEKITSAYELYHGALLRYCDSRVSSHEKAVDIVQDTYFRMWKYMFDGNLISHEKAFLYTTAKHLIVDEYRKKIAFSLDVLIDTREEPKITQSDDLYSVEEKLESIDCIKKYLKHTALYFT